MYPNFALTNLAITEHPSRILSCRRLHPHLAKGRQRHIGARGEHRQVARQGEIQGNYLTIKHYFDQLIEITINIYIVSFVKSY